MLNDYKNVINPYGFIYITTNIINGRRYIGQKSFDYKSRWYSYVGSGYQLIKAIKKYGKENFKRDIVAIAYTAKELNELEIIWIRDYNAVINENFYNMADGGDVNPQGTKIVCIDDGNIFISLRSASLYYNIPINKIKDTYKNNKKHTKKNHLNEDIIFRLVKEHIKNQKYCYICGEIFEHPISCLCKKCSKSIYECGKYVKSKNNIIIKCDNCKCLIDKTNNRRKYCKTCAKIKK